MELSVLWSASALILALAINGLIEMGKEAKLIANIAHTTKARRLIFWKLSVPVLAVIMSVLNNQFPSEPGHITGNVLWDSIVLCLDAIIIYSIGFKEVVNKLKSRILGKI